MLFVCFLLNLAFTCAISGVVESCSGWKLDDYPELGNFLKSKRGIKLYPEIKVKWITHHNPDLVINNNERIDLTMYKSRAELHTLLQSKGFTNVSPNHQYPRDKNENCKKWSQEGQCQKNRMYMMEYCTYSCNKTEL